MKDTHDKEQQKAPVKKGKYLILSFVVLLVLILGFTLNNTSQKTTMKEKVVITEQIKPIMARIDILTPAIEENPFLVYRENSDEPEPEAKWMKKRNIKGVTLQSEDNIINFKVVVQKDIEGTFQVISEDRRDENGKQIDVWIDYTSFTINGEEILPEKISVCARKPFRYKFNAKAGDTLNATAKWSMTKK